MNIFKNAVLIAAGALILAGCSHTSVETGAGPLAPATPADAAIVIGKLRIIKNGVEVGLGSGMFANRATLDLVNLETAEHTEVGVGKNGEFAWTLADGSYSLSSIDFMVRGERIRVAGEFAFDVSPADAATYIGTMTLETTFEPGYHGLSGVVDGYSIVDDCHADCAAMLTRVGLDGNAATIALLRPAGQLVTRK